MFMTTFMIIPTLIKGLLSTHIQSNKSKTLDLDLAYTEGKEDGNRLYFCFVAAWFIYMFKKTFIVNSLRNCY